MYFYRTETVYVLSSTHSRFCSVATKPIFFRIHDVREINKECSCIFSYLDICSY